MNGGLPEVSTFTYRNPLDLPRITHADLLAGNADGVFVEPPGEPRRFHRPPPAFHDKLAGDPVFQPFGEEALTSPPVFTVSMRQAALVGFRTLLSPAGFWTNDVGHVGRDLARSYLSGFAANDEMTGLVPAAPEAERRVLALAGRRTVHLSGPTVVLSSAEPGNFGSFIYRELPKLLSIADMPADWRVLIHLNSPTLREFLALAGLAPDRVVQHDLTAVYRLDCAIVPGIRNPLGFADAATRELFERIRAACDQGERGRRIYVSRHVLNAERPAHGRVMLNEAELIAALRALGFDIVEPQKLNAREQVETFTAADLVVGPSGSGMFNAVFCRPGTTLIDIESEPHWVLPHSCLFASAGLHYGIFEAAAADRDWSVHHKPFRVDVPALLGRIEAVAGRLPVVLRTAHANPRKTIQLDGVTTEIEGAADDPYLGAAEAAAAGLAPLAALARRYAGPDAVVLDVGANIGLSAILLARIVRRVIAFEPSPRNAAFLMRNLEHNGISNVEVRVCAASSAAGMLRFHEATFGAGSHVMSAGDLSAGAPFIEVPAARVDDLELPPIAFIKIDAGGHEPEVLAGARRLLARHRPLIQMEVNLWCLTAYADHHPGALVRRLWDRFDVWRSGPDGELVPLPSGLVWLHETIGRGGVDDVVVRPKTGVDMPTLEELTWPESALSGVSTPRQRFS